MATPRIELNNMPNFNYYVSTQEKHTFDKTGAGNAFNKRYYSQCDAEIYFGDIFVDDIIDLSYQISQNTQPLTGYNSYVYDEIAQGSRMVQGMFTINFTSPSYLSKVLASLQDMDKAIQSAKTAKQTNKTVPEQTPGEQQVKLPDVTTSSVVTTGPIWNRTFDINLTYGRKTTQGDVVQVILTGVVLNGNHQGVDVTGKVAVESYSFIARDIKTVG